MRISKKWFQFLVWFLLFLYAVAFFLPYAWGYMYDEELYNALLWNGWRGLLNNVKLLSMPLSSWMIFLYFIASVGLLSYKKWGRSVYLVCLLINAVLWSFNGLAVNYGIGNTLAVLTAVLNGVVLSLAFFSEIGDEFE